MTRKDSERILLGLAAIQQLTLRRSDHHGW